MEKRLAQFISVIFHPLLIPTYGLLLLFTVNAFFSLQLIFKAKIILASMVITSTVIFPVIMFAFLKYRKLISDFHMKSKEERIYPYLSLTIVYFLLYILFAQTELPPLYSFYFLTTTLIGLTLFFINIRWKISAHAAGIGGLTAMMIGLSYKLQTDLFLITSILMVCSGLVGFARLKTNSHKPSEVYTGYLVGATIFLIMFLIY